MKIFVTDPSFFTLPYDIELCEALAGNGHDVFLFGRPLRDGETFESLVRAKVLSFYYCCAEKLRQKRGAGRLFTLAKGVEHVIDSRKFVSEVSRQHPDIVHFQWLPLPLCDIHLVKEIRKITPVVMTVHDTVPFRGHPTSRLQFSRWKESLELFDALIVHTAFSKATLCANGVSEEKIHIIPHGVFPHGAAFSTKRQGAICRILVFGEIKPYKGVDLLLRAFAELPYDLRSRVRISIVGRPRMDVAPLFQLAESLGISSQVDWDLRYVPESELVDIFTGADILVFPYREIDASGALMMALPFGKPVIASALAPFVEVLGESYGACTFPPDDHHGLMQVLSLLLRDADLWEASARLSKELSETRFSWKCIATTTTDLYSTLLTLRKIRRQ